MVFVALQVENLMWMCTEHCITDYKVSMNVKNIRNANCANGVFLLDYLPMRFYNRNVYKYYKLGNCQQSAFGKKIAAHNSRTIVSHSIGNCITLNKVIDHDFSSSLNLCVFRLCTSIDLTVWAIPVDNNLFDDKMSAIQMFLVSFAFVVILYTLALFGMNANKINGMTNIDNSTFNIQHTYDYQTNRK